MDIILQTSRTSQSNIYTIGNWLCWIEKTDYCLAHESSCWKTESKSTHYNREWKRTQHKHRNALTTLHHFYRLWLIIGYRKSFCCFQISNQETDLNFKYLRSNRMGWIWVCPVLNRLTGTYLLMKYNNYDRYLIYRKRRNCGYGWTETCTVHSSTLNEFRDNTFILHRTQFDAIISTNTWSMQGKFMER